MTLSGESNPYPTVESTPDTPMIVHIVQAKNEKGEPIEYIHGPMPVSEWAAYERAHGL
jgi:hypothetical protein